MLRKFLVAGGVVTAVLIGFVALQSKKDLPPPPPGVDIEIEDLQIDIGGLDMDFQVPDLAQTSPPPISDESLPH